VTTTYSLSCTGAGGTTLASATVTLVAPTVLLRASPTAITSGGSSTLTWSSTYATSCSASGAWAGTKATAGTLVVTPAATSTYSLACGTATASATVTVNASGGGGTTAVTIAPARAALTTRQVQAFSATVTGNSDTAVTWDVDGTVGGSAAVGTISASGVYAPPPIAGVHTISATSHADPSKKQSARVGVTDLAGVFTHHNDVQRTGQNLQEYALDAATVSNPAAFGRLFSCTVDAAVYAQPLYVANLNIGGGVHNVVFVATENDSVYAFDADGARDPVGGGCLAYWYVSFVAPTVPNLSAVPVADTLAADDMNGAVGITGTPVIGNNLLYLVAKTKNTSAATYSHRLHALALGTGLEAAGAPVEITASVPSTGFASGVMPFTPLWQAQRPALLLNGGVVYVAFGSHGDNFNYTGWLLGYDAITLRQVSVFNTAPAPLQAAIWMSGSGPAVDQAGGIYFSTGNGLFDGTTNFAESLLRLDVSVPSHPIVHDFFTPAAQAALSSTDFDFGSGGVVVLPDSMGSAAHPHLIVAVDKSGNFYLVDRDAMGHYSASGNTNVQTLSVGPATESGGCAASVSCGFFSTPAVWGNSIYAAAQADTLKAYPVISARINVGPSSQSPDLYAFPGATPSISASGAGATTAIVWVVDTNANGTANSNGVSGAAILRAYDATNLATRLYSSSASAADTCGNAVKFTVPTVANGKVYVGGDGQLTVYGVKP